MSVRLALLELVALPEPVEDPLLCLRLREPGQVPCVVVHASVRPDHDELGEPVVAADLVVERVVAGRHLEGARAKLPLDAVVRDHRHGPFDVRHDHVTADELAVALILRMHRDSDIGEDRRRPNGGDRDGAFAPGERVPDVGERVVDVDVSELQVGERRLVVRAPVDDPVGAVDPVLAVEVHEEAHHRADVVVVHREALTTVVQRSADPAELKHDLAAVLAQPFPDTSLERLAAQLLPAGALACEMLLDGVLRRDSRVIEAGLEQDVEALHPPCPHDRVRERKLERMAKVEVAGHIRRRMRDHEALAVGVRVGGVETVGLPRLLPAPLDGGRVVERVHGGGV